MTDDASFRKATLVPVPRLMCYALLGLLACAAISYYQHDRAILLGGLLGIPVVMASILWLYRVGRSAFAARHAKLLIWTYIILQTALQVWDLRHRK